jgi:phospholipase/carboxylesterase
VNHLRIADLDCVMVGDGAATGPMVVLLHGFGAPGDDLVAVADELDAPPGTRWVFPAGPLPMSPLYGDARAWWMLDLERLERELAGGPVDRAAEVPVGLAEARTAITDLLAALARDHHRRDATTVLGGFSQGAMLTVDVAVHSALPFAGLVLWSGTMINEAAWREHAAALNGRRVLQSHGTHDPLLAFSGAEKLADFLGKAGAQGDLLAFPGQHEIPRPVLRRTASFLGEVLTRT